uniref:F-box domain-containing protein n=1 Tax=Aegilops tauschii subsp. strangulata TaxID=200361 RepID=A0A453GGZ8_AEGTS
MAGDDRLSALPDQLLRRVLHFAPAKEAASTRALSRRWRSPFLRSSGAVNLETRLEDFDRTLSSTWGEQRKTLEASFFSRRDAFVSAAKAALDADGHVTRLTLRVEFEFGIKRWLLHSDNDKRDGSRSQDHHVIATLLSHPAARRVEDLRLAVEGWVIRTDTYYDPESEIARKAVGDYTLSLGSLPWETLRVLNLTSCDILPPAAIVGFTRLSSMRLRHCAVRLGVLQSLVDAAPALATVHLESVAVIVIPRPPPTEVVLRCPAATVLVLDKCNWRGNDKDETPVVVAVEIRAPKLRSFLYRGLLRRLSMSPRPPDLARADLHFFRPCDKKGNKCSHLMTLWKFLQDLSRAKELKLRVNNLEDMAVLSEAGRVELLPVFSNLDRLELQGVHRPKGKSAAVAIANLLRCSPVLRHLRINLTTAHHAVTRESEDIIGYLETKFLCDRDKSIDLINRTDPTPVSLEDDGDVNGAKVSDIPGLSRRSFECLQSSLRRVGLQFRSEDSNCFGIKLIKFFAENAMVLEEMHIDGGNGKLWEHMNNPVGIWAASSSERRKRGASNFVVLPLER